MTTINKLELGQADTSVALARKIGAACGVTYIDVFSAIEESRAEHVVVKSEKKIDVQFDAEYIEKLIRDSHKLEMILNGLYSGAMRSNTRDDSIFFPVGNVNAVLKATDGERYFDELERLENE